MFAFIVFCCAYFVVPEVVKPLKIFKLQIKLLFTTVCCLFLIIQHGIPLWTQLLKALKTIRGSIPYYIMTFVHMNDLTLIFIYFVFRILVCLMQFPTLSLSLQHTDLPSQEDFFVQNLPHSLFVTLNIYQQVKMLPNLKNPNSNN